MKTSMKAANFEFLTSMLSNWAASLLQESLNCLMMFDTLSNLKKEGLINGNKINNNGASKSHYQSYSTSLGVEQNTAIK